MTLPVRKRLRIQNFDYSSEGYYFVTICTKDKKKYFGDIIDTQSNSMRYTPVGVVAEKHIKKIEHHFSCVTVDKYVVMPNHVHMIIIIGCKNKAPTGNFPTLSTIIGLYKSGVSRELGQSVWQRFYHDHVIRNETAYKKIWEYIDTNPMAWEKDVFFE